MESESLVSQRKIKFAISLGFIQNRSMEVRITFGKMQRVFKNNGKPTQNVINKWRQGRRVERKLTFYIRRYT